MNDNQDLFLFILNINYLKSYTYGYFLILIFLFLTKINTMNFLTRTTSPNLKKLNKIYV